MNIYSSSPMPRFSANAPLSAGEGVGVRLFVLSLCHLSLEEIIGE